MTYPEYEDASVAIVDPSRHMRSVLKNILRSHGFRRFHEADNSADGLKALLAEPADIVFVEYDLLPVNGIEFTKFVRRGRAETLRRLPIVMLTTHAEEETVLGAREAGVDAFLVKPISANGLRLHLERLTAAKKLAPQVVECGKSARPQRRHLSPADVERILDEIGFHPEPREEPPTDGTSRMLTAEEIASMFA